MPLIRYEDRLPAPSRRRAKQLNRSLDDAQGRHDMALARLHEAAEKEAARIAAMGYVTRAGMLDAAVTSKFEEVMVGMAPLGSGRVGAIADIGCLATGEMVHDAKYRLR